jgi:hypothetical protein
MLAPRREMDTRHKILTPDQALASLKGCHAFVAYFDVLTAPLVRRLAEIEQPVAAVVLDPPDPILSSRTRAELAAALAHVEAVIQLPEDPANFLEALEPVRIVHWEHEDAQRTARLIDHVQSL